VSHAAIIERSPRHARILGAPGSGKTTVLVERYRVLAARGHRPGIVAFGREHRDRLFERVIPDGGAHLGAPPVTTHALVAASVLDAARPRRPRTLRDVDELLVPARLLRRESALLQATSPPSPVRRHSSRFAGDTARAGTEWNFAGCGAIVRATLRKRAGARRVCPCALPRALRRARPARFMTRHGAQPSASTRAASNRHCRIRRRSVDDFHDLDPGQYRLLTRLVPPGGAAKLEVFGDPTGHAFVRGTSDRFLLDLFPATTRAMTSRFQPVIR
jgi:hypothetical protein